MRLFRYHRPTTVAEATGLLVDLGEEAVVLAGGTSVMNMARLGLAEPEHVVALGAVPGLSGIRRSDAGGLVLGAMTTLREVETSGLVHALAPGLAEAAGHVATVRIRNQATVGGNLVHADPNQDVPPMLMVHEAVARVHGPDGTRDVPVSDMFVGFLESDVGPEEVLEHVHVPAVPTGMRTGYLKFLPRTQDDYPTVSVAAGVVVVDGRVQDVRIAVAGGGATTVRCRDAETALTGRGCDERSLLAAADAVAGQLDPISDGRGSSGYKRAMARVCTQRLLQRLVTKPAA